MTVKKVKGGFAVKHCKSAKRGQTIKKFKTKKGAMSMHRAIQANKKK